MKERTLKAALILLGSALIVGKGVRDIRRTQRVEQAKRQVIWSDAMIETEAIEKSVDIINERISRGEIRTHEQLREAVLTEVAFQTIAIHEAEVE